MFSLYSNTRNSTFGDVNVCNMLGYGGTPIGALAKSLAGNQLGVAIK
jgi:hypothetical protein